jgi:hypothetical protein
MNELRKHLTYANVMVTILAFVVLGGATAFAASHLGKNSVGSKQLKKNAVVASKIKKEAVTGAKVKKDTLTGTQINEEKLGTVPAAGFASTIPPAEAVRQVGAPGQPPFLFKASSAPPVSGVQFTPVGFYKDQFGVVHLEGILKVGESPIAFQLPPGYRPASGQINLFASAPEESIVFVAGSNVSVGPENIEGFVVAQAGGVSELVVLSGISFRAAS